MGFDLKNGFTFNWENRSDLKNGFYFLMGKPF
jgi:hypothetical protein